MQPDEAWHEVDRSHLVPSYPARQEHARRGYVAHQSRDRAIIAYYREGRTLAECGAFFGVTKSRISQILKRDGIRTRRVRS